LPADERPDFANTSGVKCMALRNPELRAVIFSQSLVQRPSCGVDGGRVLQRRLELRFDAGQQGWFTGEEFFDRLCVFLGVAGHTCRDKVAHSVRATLRPGNAIVKVERDIDRAAIDAVSSELLENLFPDFVTSERAVLIRNTSYFRVFEELHVDGDPLDGHSRDRGKAAKPPDP
jgi:hypothetical protein